jgi:hypothetical protein
MQITQVSAILGFLPVTIVSWQLQLWVGTGVYVGNLMSTLYVHRVHRTEERDMVDSLDESCIGLWVIYNTGVSVRVGCMLWMAFTFERFLLLLGALFGAVASGILDLLRRQYKWRSRRRNLLHICMHLSGGFGSLLLQLATV